LLVRRIENGENARELVDRAAQAAGVRIVAISSARSPDDGPDLGSAHFHLLARPRIAVLSNSPISPDAFGQVWHLFDRELGEPTTLLDAQSLSSYDLRRYNVIVLPPGAGREILEPVKDDLQAWVRSGGTLIAMASSAVAIADEKLGLSQVRRRE